MPSTCSHIGSERGDNNETTTSFTDRVGIRDADQHPAAVPGAERLRAVPPEGGAAGGSRQPRPVHVDVDDGGLSAADAPQLLVQPYLRLRLMGVRRGKWSGSS